MEREHAEKLIEHLDVHHRLMVLNSPALFPNELAALVTVHSPYTVEKIKLLYRYRKEKKARNKDKLTMQPVTKTNTVLLGTGYFALSFLAGCAIGAGINVIVENVIENTQ